MDFEKIFLILIGAFVGFFSSIAKDYFIEKTKRKYKEIELKRYKLEELYLSLDNWFHFISIDNIMFLQVMTSLIEYEEYNKKKEEVIKEFPFDTRKQEMLVNLYCNEYLEDYSELKKKIEDLSIFRLNYLKNENKVSKDDFEYYKDKNLKLIKKTEDFKDKIVSLVEI